MNINNLGFNSFHEENSEVNRDNSNVGRIISVNKESYILSDGLNEYFAKLTGNMIYSADSVEDFPTVGDFVQFQKFDDDSLAIILKVLNRKSLLKRKNAGKKVDYQLIGANIDFAIIMQALDNDFNINRLERYLTMVKEFGVEPVLLFSKSDLINKDECNKIMTTVKQRIPETKIISFSNFEDDSINHIMLFLKTKKTYCIIGSSGVGKTTLINNLLGKNEFQTKDVRAGDSKGKHTTTNRHLVILNNGAMIIDTPGMRELANISASEGIEQTFDEITELSKNCKFSDCTHTVEKGCAILKALENSDLNESRYENYIKLKKESDHYERTYLERKTRDKEFGKMVKSIMKHKHKRR